MESQDKMILIILVACMAISCAQTGQCPEKYSSLSATHSFCLDPNPTCAVLKAGVDKEDIKTILKLHNKLRSKIANGREKGAGGLPAAADMLQLEWDHELASVAQKWASQCEFKHDCNDCRQVQRFKVGQNMGFEGQTCSSDECFNNAKKPNWEGIITDFYKEVNDYDKNDLSSFKQGGSKDIGHFTQVVWAKSWKIGCGFVAYKEGAVKKIYVCNYGPAGNYKGRPLYQPGEACSACPTNTCCGGACKVKGRKYKGLCKVTNLSEGPKY